MANTNNPLVSIIIPVYCREQFVKKTLDNVYASDYRPLELVLVNDGSTDRSLEVLEAFQRQYSCDDFKVKVYSQQNKGAPAARNLGYANATGDFIQFLDSDDLVSPDKFHLQVELMIREQADFALCDFEMVYSDRNERVYYSNAEKLRKVLRTHGSFGCGSPLLKRELANRIQWNTRLKRNQDVDYFQKAAILATRIVYIPSPHYTYIRHGSERISMTYDRTDPVYGIRIKSLIDIWKYKRNRFYLVMALKNLTLSFLRFKISATLK